MKNWMNLLEEQIAAGTDAIIICGTTGESATLSEKEHLDAIKFTIERVKGRIPVIAGTGSQFHPYGSGDVEGSGGKTEQTDCWW